MLCINSYTQEYIDECRARVHSQLSAYNTLVTVARKQSGANGARLDSAVADFEPMFFNNLVLALDNYFCHRSRTLEKKDGNPLNEVRILCSSMMNNNDIMSADKTIKLDPAKSVLKHKVGDEINLSEADFALLSEAFFAEIEAKFL
jgi:hypothetical protein